MALILRFKLAKIGARGMKIVGGAMQSTFRFEARELAGTTPKICKTPEKVPGYLNFKCPWNSRTLMAGISVSPVNPFFSVFARPFSGKNSKKPKPTIPIKPIPNRPPFPDRPPFRCEKCWMFPIACKEPRKIFDHNRQVEDHHRSLFRTESGVQVRHKCQYCPKCGNGFQDKTDVDLHLEECPQRIWEDCKNAM